VLCELTSDEAACAEIGDTAGYADVLRRVASEAPPFAATLAMATPSTLSHRLRRLALRSISAPRLGSRQTAALICAILFLIVLAAAPMGRATVRGCGTGREPSVLPRR